MNYNEPNMLEPLDLDEVEHLHREATGEAADADADAKLVDEVVPRLVAELRQARAELERVRAYRGSNAQP